MPKARRRRLNRLRKNIDNHTWMAQPLKSRSESSFTIPSDGVKPQYDFNFKMNFHIVSSFDAEERSKLGPVNYRKCSKCGQESINGKIPKFSCREFIVRHVMEK